MTRWKRRRSDRSGRAPLPSPGRPPVAGRDELRRFWAAIALGLSSEDAAAGANVPQAVGARWFRKAGGMPPAMFGTSARPLSGRYLSFAEREEIALLRAQGCTVQEVARQIGRAASTISRELRRNAATRSGGLEYRASTAQWHAERSARRPKQTKLVLNATLQAYVQDRLAGLVEAPKAFLFLARPYLGKGDDTDRGGIADGRVPGVQSRSLVACRSTSRMTSPCASAMRLSTRPCSSKVEARCVAN
jgi:transposase-like protein